MKTKNQNLEFRNQNLDNNLSSKSYFPNYLLNSLDMIRGLVGIQRDPRTLKGVNSSGDDGCMSGDDKSDRRGFSLIEMIFAVAIFMLIVVAFGAFQRDVFYFNDILQTGLTNVTEARKVIRPFVNEVRGADQSDLGAFAIAQAATSSFAFYVDTDRNGSRERIRYFLDNGEFKKGVIEPSGNPLTYNPNNEKVIKVIRDVLPTDAIFTYYNSTYTGTSTDAALPHPVTPAEIRLVRIDLTVDANPNRAPSLLTITTQATIRNLKDNFSDDEN